jgi:ribosomal protein S18 acetylase RimI-like enzyme
MTDIRALTELDWRRLRTIRLRALRDAPRAFTASYYQEAGRDESWWRERLRSDIWLLAFRDHAATRPAGVISATEGLNNDSPRPYINSLWVEPAHRRQHIARSLMRAIMARVAQGGADTVSLWVLDGNEPALALYLAAGFRRTEERQLLPGSVNLHEELLTRYLPPGCRGRWAQAPGCAN